MLDQDTVFNLAKKNQIAPEHIAREIYELLILRDLSRSPLVDPLIFKGGTALRLAYHSPRFSEDLDFSLLKPMSLSDLDGVIKKIDAEHPEITIADISNKKYTHFALLKIKEKFLAQPFSIKIEISKRPLGPIKPTDYHLSILASDLTPINAYIKVFALPVIFRHKLDTIQNRIKPRDLFDLWYLSEKLQQPITIDIKGFAPSHVKQELNKYLPKHYYHITKMLMEKYANHSHPKTTKRAE